MIRVVKLGGSLHTAPELADWLSAVANAGGRVVLVPGGGPFADQVRVAQARWRFSDSMAHRMALLAMEQYGLMLCGLASGLEPAASRDEIAVLLARGATPVWQPTKLCLNDPDIPENWDVTSDSLALWLAGVLDADAVALIKHAAPGADKDIAQLAEAGQVDRAFPAYLARRPLPVRIFGRNDMIAFEKWLDDPACQPGNDNP